MIETQPRPAAETGGLTPEQRQIVQTLSDERYEWKSLDRISEATGLGKEALDAAMTQLLRKDIVKPVFGKRSIIFGLRDRVEKK